MGTNCSAELWRPIPQIENEELCVRCGTSEMPAGGWNTSAVTGVLAELSRLRTHQVASS